MIRTVLAIIFVLVPVLAMAGFPQNEFARNSVDAIANDVVNPVLFNAVERTVALELRCHPDCDTDPRPPNGD